MRAFNVNRFIDERSPTWNALEQLLLIADRSGTRKLTLAQARQLAKLYRAVSSDLIRARSENVEAGIVDYLNDLVARCYAVVYAGSSSQARRLLAFFVVDFPRLVRAERAAICISAAVFLLGAAFGAVAQAVDPSARGIVIPAMHQEHSPTERVAEEEKEGGLNDANVSAAFSSFLFTHNIEVTFLAFALGILLGLGTLLVLFVNGVPLGAIAVEYAMAGKGLFFWAWILPHGIPELTQIFIAGGAGLMLGRAFWMPGRRSRVQALRVEAGNGARLIVGGMPILVVAGLVEGTISQMHEPAVSYLAKLIFAAVLGTALYAFLILVGRNHGTSTVPGRT